MAGPILEAIRSPDEAQETAEAGRRRVRDLYSWGPLSEKLQRVWRSAAGLEHSVGARQSHVGC